MAPETKKSEPAEQPEGDLHLLRRRLYAKEESPEVQRRSEELHRLGISRQEQRIEDPAGAFSNAKYKNILLIRARRWGRIVRFSGAALLVLMVVMLAVAATVWYRSTQTVRQAQVALAVEAPTDVTSGSEITYLIRYGNTSRVDWEDVELSLSLPRGFMWRGGEGEATLLGRQAVFTIGTVASGDTGEVTVRGQLIGEQNETAVAEAELILTPENTPSAQLTKRAAVAATITALPLDVSLDIPGDAASGERILASISVGNLSETQLAGGYLRLTPAPGVELAADDPDFSADFSTAGSQWNLPDLAPLEVAERRMVFYLAGQPGEKRVINVEAGIHQDGEDFTQRQLTHVMLVSETEVTIRQVFNERASPLTVTAGETVAGKVEYHNIGSVGLRGAIVRVSFEGLPFDPASLVLDGAGSYDPVTRSISWSAATVPELAVVQPQESGSLAYSFRVRPTAAFPTEAADAKNHVLVTTATVDSPDLPAPAGQPREVVSDRGVLSVKTDLILTAAAFYDDGRLGITSSGPLPPRVGQTTSYTLRWRIGSTLNDIAAARLTAVIPDGVSFTGQTYSTGGEVQTDPRTGELVWTLPFVEGLTGRAAPHQELHVQVAITPGEDKRGESIDLLNRTTFEAVDQFVDEALQVSLDSFPTTSTAVPDKGAVQ